MVVGFRDSTHLIYLVVSTRVVYYVQEQLI